MQVDDQAILDFWRLFSEGDEFRGYRTVFDVFVTFIKSLEESQQGENIERAAVIGTDHDNFEVEPDDDAAGDDSLYGDWQSPLNVLDEEPAARIKFFKKENERKPIEKLMFYGPYASRLPLAFLRLEAFGPVQAGITNDLQIKRGAKEVKARLDCADAEPYVQKHDRLQEILALAKQLQKATLHALQSGRMGAGPEDNVVSLFGDQGHSHFDAARRSDEAGDLDDQHLLEAAKIAEQAFMSLTRKGFDESFLANDENIEGFRIGAGALIAVGSQLETFIAAIRRLDAGDSGLENMFSEDRKAFSAQFHTIYGDG